MPPNPRAGGARPAGIPSRPAPAQESAIRAFAGTKSLRSLPADFGVGHETVRAVCRRRRLA